MSTGDEPIRPAGFSPGGEPGGEALSATRFEPMAAGSGPPKQSVVTPLRVTVGLTLIIAAALLFFLFTARSLEVVVDTETAATVSIEGLAVPVGSRWLIRPGVYEATVAAPGYAVWQQQVTITEDASQRLDVTPAILPGKVSIVTEPTGATVMVGDETLGTTPLADLTLAAGDLVLNVTLDRYQATQQAVTITGREVAQTLAFDLVPDWAEIQFTSTPVQVSVSIDDLPVDYTPGQAIEVLSGERLLTIQAPGFQPATRDLTVVAGDNQDLGSIELAPAEGLLSLTSSPTGANVTVNGEFQGRTPVTLALAPDRNHRISLARPGYTRANITQRMDQGSTLERAVTLEPRLGEVNFRIEPADAELLIDGRVVGTGDQSRELTAIEHRIEVRLEGYAPYRDTILPREGLAQRVDVTLVTEAEARRAALKPEVTTALGQTLLLIDPVAEPVNAFTLGAPRRDPGRRSNETLRAVRLERAFYIATTETTNAQFRQFMAGHDSGQLEGNTLNREHQPVVTISWQQAASFCNWLSRREGLPPFYREEQGIITGFNASSTGYRLPSEAEWAFVSRIQGEEILRHAWGNDFPPATSVTNVADNTSAFVTGRILNGYADGHIVSAPVASYPANPRGLYDLGGNVAEWVHDVYSIPPASTEEQVDPLGALRGDNYTVRGGSWALSRLSELRLTFRDYGASGRDDLGFRVARYAE